MDYEKMYKAVLKTATQWIKDGCSDKEKICLESIFPELRESEDERISKAIWEALNSHCNSISILSAAGFQMDDVCAWLEKQKECVADSSKTSANEDESIRKFLVDYFTSYKIGNVATKLNGVRIDDILNYLEKQKEQKPVDYAEELKKCKDNPLYFYDKYVKVKQKPAEWSDEDEKMLQSIIKDFRAGKVSTIGQEQWLKSLRPSWKPSEEQMKALEEVAYNLVGTGTDTDVYLVQLYEQLKKLM